MSKVVIGADHNPQAFHDTVERLSRATQRFVNGDNDAWKALCSHSNDVSIAGRAGGFEKGWDNVEDRYDWVRDQYVHGDISCEIINRYVSGDLAYYGEVVQPKWLYDFGSRGSDRRTDDLPSNHIEVDHERQGAVADVLELPSHHLAWPQRQAWRGPLQGLDPSHLVSADRAFPGCHARGRFSIDGAHVSDLLIALFGWLVCGGCEPIPNQVWFEIGLF